MASLRTSLLAAAAEDGALFVAQGKGPSVFEHSTPRSDASDWAGACSTDLDAPVDSKSVGPSLAASGASAANLQLGTHLASLPANGKRNGQVGAMAFVVDEFTTHNAREGDRFEAKVNGLLENQVETSTTFVKAASADDKEGGWAQVAADGTLSGTPDSAGETRVTVEATSPNGSKARLQVKIPVRDKGAPMVDKLGMLSFNVWEAGKNVNDAYCKQLRYISGTGVDIVGFQESNGGYATRLGQALGWHAWQERDVGIISRYPIAKVLGETDVAGGVLVALDGEQRRVVVWNVHLGYTPYGPYDFCFDKMSVDRVLQREADSGRTPQIVDVMRRMKGQIADADRVPVVLTGDFNVPSHLDWTEATRAAHCGVGAVPWPTSEEPTKAGLRDSFREVHEDPRETPGITWSPIFLDNKGRPEPLDRIDFIYHKGLETVEYTTEVVGQPKPEPNHRDNEWTSDHATVKTVFRFAYSKRVRRAFQA